MLMVFPSSLLNPRCVDEHFEEEVVGNDYVLFSEYEGRVLTRGRSLEGEVLFYRGWILSSSVYGVMEEAIARLGGRLFSDSGQYVGAQFANGWLSNFFGVTPDTRVVPYGAGDGELLGAVESLGASQFVIKGVSKSCKDDWDNAMFVKDAGDIVRVVNNFRDRVSESEEPSILIREFEDWLPGEIRSWWIDGRLVFIEPHPQSVDIDFDEESLRAFLNGLASAVEGTSNAVTVDVVRDIYGNWRVVEVGSACVSESRENVASFLI